MKKLLLFMIGTMLTFAAYGQSKLPPCRGSNVTKWNNCFGIETFPSGSKYVGEFKDDEYHGQGTYISANGSMYVGQYKKQSKAWSGNLYLCQWR